MECPLPIDWLDFLEGEMPQDAAAHLRDCPSCKLVVSSLHTSSVHEFGDWLADIDVKGSGALEEFAVQDVELGQVWLSRSSYETPFGGYKDLDRLLLVVLDKPTAEHDRTWVDVAPLWMEPDEATPLDILLDESDSSFSRPWALMLRFQTVVEESQLEGCVGRLTDSGRLSISAAVQGEADELRRGFPLENADDSRLRTVADLRSTIDSLSVIYAMYLEQLGDEDIEDADYSKVLTFRSSLMERRFSTRDFALAAKAGVSDQPRIWSLQWGSGKLKGHLEFHLRKNLLIFVVMNASGFDEEVRLVGTVRFTEPVTSDPFLPSQGERVPLRSEKAISDKDIEDLRLEPVDG